MELTPNTITLTTIDGGITVVLNFMGAFKGDPGTDGLDGENGVDGDTPTSTELLRIPIIEWETEERFAAMEDEFGLILGNFPTEQLFKLAEIPAEDVPKFGAGTYMSLCQKGVGAVLVQGEPGVTVETPGGYLPYTRAQGSIITATCLYPGTNEWILSGDLALVEVGP